MKLRIATKAVSSMRLAIPLAIGLTFGNAAWGKPLIQSIEVSPNPLITGQSFTVSVTASPETIQATAAVEFRKGTSQLVDVPLTNQGTLWTGSGIVPADLEFKLPDKAEADIKIAALDAKLHQDKGGVRVDVNPPTVTAVYADGVLTITGDDQDNTLTASRDAAGNILVNGGALPVTGGLPTVANTTLIRIFGLKGNDFLLIDDANGPMPPGNLSGGEGDDTLTGSASDDVLDGGPGNDTLNGRDGNDILLGGPGNDILIGGRGTDQIFGGEGDDQIVWNPGDGSDLIEGEDGIDTLVFNGSNIGELIDLSANGPRLRLFRNVANITMDCAGIERVAFNALSGADSVTVNDLTGTQVTNVIVDLSGISGTNVADGLADTVIVNGTATNDVITLNGSVTNVNVLGLSSSVTVIGGEPAFDKIIVNGLGGDDRIDASAVKAGAIELTLNGGAGNDVLIGGQGNDILIGAQGNDVVFGGAGDDTFVWNPGDGSDVFEGQGGVDTMLFNGANIAENIDVSANGQRVRFFRNVANITMDCNGIEKIQFNALGGADTITVNDLTGTDVSSVNLDLAGLPAAGAGDNLADTVIINATTGNDTVTITGTPAAGVSIQGLLAVVNIVGTDPSLDKLIVNTLEGDDVIDASGLQAGVISLTADGGPNNDVLIGSQGDDVLLGGTGDDVLIGGSGQDLLDGGPGDNIVIQ